MRIGDVVYTDRLKGGKYIAVKCVVAAIQEGYTILSKRKFFVKTPELYFRQDHRIFTDKSQCKAYIKDKS